ncbi:MAG: hypothetical protein WCH62_05605 [Candidatus Omnitrophota bacterium]
MLRVIVWGIVIFITSLNSVSAKSGINDQCNIPALAGYERVCIACGDGICDERYEYQCNCPQDCAKNFIKKGN